ncbi:MAG: glycerol-3-phosphate dehydrogenase, partial [Gammaproteobacteria bacterium]|nr:glycerol-3-phosphate dehydrogenase [Gammaproteobacteria bacterium]
MILKILPRHTPQEENSASRVVDGEGAQIGCRTVARALQCRVAAQKRIERPFVGLVGRLTPDLRVPPGLALSSSRRIPPPQPRSRPVTVRPPPPALPEACDLLVVGGGVNGAGIARDAAGRGLKVVLVEQHDLASHTSSASTKLIHGGLRYLEFMQFGLVRKALAERETLLGIAPHIMWPLRFVMPHDASLRPAWMIRAGLFLYDHLARLRHLAGSRGIDLRNHPAGAPLREGFARGFEYSDGWVDDARLVVLNALDAAEHGAVIATRTRCTALAAAPGGGWVATLQATDRPAAQAATLRARAVVNAAGPWAAQLHDLATPGAARHGLRLVKGSHIVVPRLFDHPYAYIFQASDRRIVFAIPYEGGFTLIGTTDVEHHADPAAPRIDAEETAYLCREAGRYFRRPVSPADVVWSYSGVRPLLEDETHDARAVSRDYALVLDRDPAPLLSVFGGKITTYRLLA